ncbi:Centrosomal protein of 83 kDa [Dinochytrium kinnereticum]|nr:Centrosomal protein of 83 kDa [Dinochytrium kinnereticum]
MEIADKLSVSLGLVEALKAENDVYKQNFNELKLNHESLCQKFEQLQTSYQALASERVRLAGHWDMGSHSITKDWQSEKMEDAESFWKKKYEEQRDEMNALRKQAIDPKELEKIKLQLLCDLEHSHSKRISQLEEGIVYFKSQYFSLRKQHELLKAESNHKLAEDNSARRHREQQLEEEIEVYQKKLNSLEGQIDLKVDMDKLRQLQRENTEYQLRLKSLTQEIEELREKKESISLESEQRERLLSRRLTEEIAQSKSLSIDNETLKTKLQASLEENRKLIKNSEETANEIGVLKKKITHLQNLNEEQSHRLSLEISEAKKSAVQKQRASDLTLSKAKSRLLELEGQLQSANQRIKEQQDSVANLQRDCLDKIGKAREEERANYNNVLTEKQQELNRVKKELKDSMAFGESVVAQNERLLTEQEKALTHFEAEKARANKTEAAVVKLNQEVDDLRIREASLKDNLQRMELLIKLSDEDARKMESELKKENDAILHNENRKMMQLAKEREELRKQIARLEYENSSMAENDRTMKEVHNVSISQGLIPHYRSDQHGSRKSHN